MLERVIQAAELVCRKPRVAFLRGVDLFRSARDCAVMRATGMNREAVHRVKHEFDSLVAPDITNAIRINRDVSSFNPLRELYSLARLIDAEVIIETGVASGFSSAAFLGALATNGNGRLYSIELPNRPKVGWAVPERFHSMWDLRLGPSVELLGPLLEEIGSVDIFMHDSDHSYENMMFEFTVAWPRIRSGGLLVSDDIHWNNAFFDFCRSVHRYPIFLDPRRSAVIRK